MNTSVLANAPAKGRAKPSTVGAVKATNFRSSAGESSPSLMGLMAAAKLITVTSTAAVSVSSLSSSHRM